MPRFIHSSTFRTSLLVMSVELLVASVLGAYLVGLFSDPANQRLVTGAVIAGAILVVLLTGIVTLVIHDHRVSRRIQALVSVFEQAQQGNFDARIQGLASADALDVVQRSTNAMLDARQQAEDQIAHLNRVLQAIRNVNQLITHERDRTRLINEACQRLIETGGYKSAWIVVLDEQGVIIQHAQAGLDDRAASLFEHLGQGKVVHCFQTALSAPGVHTVQDVQAVCANCPASTAHQSDIALTKRLAFDEKVYGILTVSLSAELTLNDEEISLFDEAAGDVAFALYSIGVDEERRQATAALRDYSLRLEEMVEERTRALHEAQDELVNQEKMALLGKLAASMGHELRNPLGVISNAAYFLQYSLDQDLGPASETLQREYLSMVLDEVHKATAIIVALLTFSNPPNPDPQPTPLKPVIRQVLEQEPPPDGIRVTTDLPDDLPALHVDPEMITQALTKLVENAYQAMEEVGILTLSASRSEGRVHLTVQDTGAGIAAAYLEEIFEPLFTTKARGLGLGLAMARTLVQANGGAITVESQGGQGARFTLHLPIALAPVETGA